MKVYISVDIEGCTGITHWDEAEKNHADYPEFREQMTREAKPLYNLVVLMYPRAVAARCRDAAHRMGANL